MTALALSQDHTFIAAGHASGHVFLYNLEKPSVPARSVPTTTISTVASGRKEGHLANSRISRIGFVGKRHTGIISTDENGLAFFHSLGRVLVFEANDVLRVLGKYPSEPKSHSRSASRNEDPPPRSNTTILAMDPLPLGGVPDPVDEYHLTAILTPVKLVIVGLKPSPRTWYRQHRTDVDAGAGDGGEKVPSEERWRGCLAWRPLSKTEEEGESKARTKSKANSKSAKSKEIQSNGNGTTNPTPSSASLHPLLIYSWGRKCQVLRVREEVTVVAMINPKTGKTVQVNNGKVLFDDVIGWTAGYDLIGLRWLNMDVSRLNLLSCLERSADDTSSSSWA